MNFLILSITDAQLRNALAQVVGEDFSLSIARAKLLVDQKVNASLGTILSHDTKIVIERIM